MHHPTEPAGAPPAHLDDPGAAALAACPEAAILLSLDHRIIDTNAAYLARYPAAEGPKGRRCFEVSHGYQRPCDQEGESCPARACRSTGRPATVVHRHRHPNPAGGPPVEHLCDIELRPIFAANGTLHAFLEIVRPASPVHRRGGLVGRSPAYRELIDHIDRVAPSPAPVLLLGETGTGKERVAEAIHQASARADGPMVAVECPSVQESLFESELFGHERGAFTGADRRRLGLVDAARGGTLFLDEIGELSLSTQARLLRLLEAGTYRRVGSTEPLRADFRLIAATHRDIPAMVAEGRFRADLYYRLAVYPIRVPALRERREDLPLLVEALLAGRGSVSAEALSALQAEAWPGNVRQLRNRLERGLLLAGGRALLPADLLPGPLSARPPTPGPEPSGAFTLSSGLVTLAELEERYLRWAEHSWSGQRRDLAEALGLSERQLYRRLAEARSHP